MKICCDFHQYAVFQTAETQRTQGKFQREDTKLRSFYSFITVILSVTKDLKKILHFVQNDYNTNSAFTK